MKKIIAISLFVLPVALFAADAEKNTYADAYTNLHCAAGQGLFANKKTEQYECRFAPDVLLKTAHDASQSFALYCSQQDDSVQATQFGKERGFNDDSCKNMQKTIMHITEMMRDSVN